MPRPKATARKKKAAFKPPADLADRVALHRVEVGENLRIAVQAIMDATSKSQAEIARQFDASPQKLGNWLRGDDYPNPLWIKRFCHRYGVTTDWIYRGTPVAVMAASLADALEKSASASAAAKSARGRPEGESE